MRKGGEMIGARGWIGDREWRGEERRGEERRGEERRGEGKGPRTTETGWRWIWEDRGVHGDH